ncbi:MAG: hypothetical protein JSW60_03935 [Thermoplasmatales archaeon]|nr:MAG: hypothetical protein JSW60_03935 [Thermoplasmatales archaeon]
MRKKLIIGLLFALMLLLPSSVALSNSTQYSRDNELPDLVVTDIYPYTHCIPVATNMACWIKNKGDSTAVGSIDVGLIVWRMVFGIIPIKVYEDIESETTNGLNPGGKVQFQFNYLPSKGLRIYRFDCYVNVYNRTEESNYDNNHYSETHFVLDPESAMFGWWRLR